MWPGELAAHISPDEQGCGLGEAVEERLAKSGNSLRQGQGLVNAGVQRPNVLAQRAAKPSAGAPGYAGTETQSNSRQKTIHASFRQRFERGIPCDLNGKGSIFHLWIVGRVKRIKAHGKGARSSA
jgi:hypothetical protein